MRQVTEQELLDITLEVFQSLGYFDQKLVERVWTEHGRILSLPYDANYQMSDIYNGVEPYSDEGFALFHKWLAEQEASYYAADHEDFSITKAIEMALYDGTAKVYVEDLS